MIGNCSMRLALFALAVLAALETRGENWPQWRGPNNDGVSPETNLPTTWNRTENVAWRLALPGAAGATPVVWGDRIFLTTAKDPDLELLCVSTAGKILWERKIGSGNQNVRGDEGNFASPSPVTDGKHVWAIFGNGDLACYTVDGKKVWQKNLQDMYGPFSIQFGLASTPVLDADRLYFQLLNSNYALVVALDKMTGRQIWKQPRPSDATAECEHSYASPMLYRSGKQEFLLSHGCDYVVAHNLKTGQEIWRCGGMNPKGKYNQSLRFVASPVAVPGLIVVPSAKNGPVLALRPDAKGNITNSPKGHVWTRAQNTPDVPSPLVHDGLVYLCRENGLLMCLDAQTGEEYYQKRGHSDRHRASPVYADGKIYLTARDGVVTVVKAGREFEVLASNDLGEPAESISASPAVANGHIYLRTFDALYCIGASSSIALTPAKPAEPESIFNGQDFSGWVVEGTKDYDHAGQKEPVWTVADGNIQCAGTGYGFLRYDRMLTDFSFSVEYKMTKRVKQCNSGVGIRGVAFHGPKETRPSFAGYEIQLLDDSGKKPDDHSSGSLYRYVAPTASAVKPVGEWNTFEVECAGPRIRVTINGTLVQDVDQSKIDSIKDKPLKGYLSLQNHGGRIEFRNLQLRELDTAQASTAHPAR